MSDNYYPAELIALVRNDPLVGAVSCAAASLIYFRPELKSVGAAESLRTWAETYIDMESNYCYPACMMRTAAILEYGLLRGVAKGAIVPEPGEREDQMMVLTIAASQWGAEEVRAFDMPASLLGGDLMKSVTAACAMGAIPVVVPDLEGLVR